MRRNTIGLIWLAGIVFTLILYRVGPENVVQSFGDVLLRVQDGLQELLGMLAVNTYQLMRAFAIGLFPVFVALCLMAMRRGLRARRALIVVSVLFVAMLYGPVLDGDRISSNRWMAAFLLVSIGSAVMTQRLTARQAVVAQPGWQPGR